MFNESHNMEKKRSIALKRKVEAYPPPKYYGLLESYREANDMGRSETLNYIVRHFFDTMPASEIDRIRHLAGSKNSY